MKALIEKLRSGVDLNSADIGYAVTLLLSDKTDDELKAEFLTGLHRKGESAEEIVAFVHFLMERAIDPTIDAVLAAGGAVVIKHGNRSVTSTCGSADVLEELGVPIHLAPQELRECVKRHGLAFIFARQYHPAFRALAETRRRLARQNTRTVFNLLGPLLNPARPSRQLVGVFAPRLTTVFADVLRQLGRARAWVVHGLGDDGAGMDDVSISGATTIAELVDDKVISAVLDVNWLGIARASVAELGGGSAKENAATLEGILAGETTGPKRDMVVVNAAAGFVVAGLARDLKDGIELARVHLDSGGALEKLRALQNYNSKLST